MKRILIEVHEGQVVRNLLENNLLSLITQQGCEVLLVTSGARVPAFVRRYQQPGVTFRDLNLISTSLSRAENYEFAFSKWLAKRQWHSARRVLWEQWGEPTAARRAQRERQLLEEWKPDLVISTHLSQIYGRGLVAAARKMGIPTLGNLNSWDNAWKGLRIRPDVITCWSNNNVQEVSTLNAYKPEAVKVIGAPAFDPYFAPDAQWTREAFCSRLELNPERPILVFATLGQFSQQIDETNPLEVLLRAIDDSKIRNQPQVILRLHPWSRDTFFKPFIERSDVTVSRYENYIPGLGWAPTRDEVIMAGNLLKHADVVLSPGSTMSIEPAIFDTPTIVPVFNEYMPEVFDDYFKRTWINQHFGRLHKNNWIPIVRSADAMINAVNRALEDPAWYQDGRKKIREEFLGPLDGKATERFVETILEMVNVPLTSARLLNTERRPQMVGEEV